METRPAKELSNINLDDMSEAELEAYIQSLEKIEEEGMEKVKSLDCKLEHLNREVEAIDRKIEDSNRKITAGHEKAAELQQARLDLIDEMLPYTGKVTKFDLSKLQSEDARFMEIIRRDPQQKDSLPRADSSTPPSKASDGDDVSSDLSDLSLSRRESSSSDELERKTPKKPSSPSPLPPPRKLSSSAIMSAALPSLPPIPSRPAPKPEPSGSLAGAGQVQSVIGKSPLQLDEEQKRQAPADKALAGLVAKLGLNKDQSASSPQPSSAGSVVTPVLQQQQRNGLSSVH